MELQITTTYENINQEWLDWYYRRLANEEVLPGSTSIVKELKIYGNASFVSKDPSSDVVAITEYQVTK